MIRNRFCTFCIQYYIFAFAFGIDNYIDFTLIRVCHIKREKQHRVFKGVVKKGKSTMGWFCGFKLHLIINDRGEVLSFYLSEGNVDDRNIDIMTAMTKVSKNMKQQNLSDIDAILLRKRALIESVNDELKNICKVKHTRHRSVKGFLANMVAGLAAYCFFPKKPSLNITPIETNQLSFYGPLKHYYSRCFNKRLPYYPQFPHFL